MRTLTYDEQYRYARQDHAFFLRLDGLTLQKIGDRMGCDRERARQMIQKARHRHAKSAHRTRFTFQVEVVR